MTILKSYSTVLYWVLCDGDCASNFLILPPPQKKKPDESWLWGWHKPHLGLEPLTLSPHEVHGQQKGRARCVVHRPLSFPALEDVIVTERSQPRCASCRKFGTVIGESGVLLRPWASSDAHLVPDPADATGEQQVREGSR